MSLYFEVYDPLKRLRKESYPLSPQVSIRLSMYRTESNGAITLGPYLATDKEVDHAIDFLIKELEQVRKSCKKTLKANIKKQSEN